MTTATGHKSGRKLLAIDTAYTHRIMRERNIFALLTARDLGGYFDHVWAVHPFASMLYADDDPERFGPPNSYEIGPRHTLIEGKFGRYAVLARWTKFNFLLSQIGLFAKLWWLIISKRIDVVRAEDPLYNGMFGWLLARTTFRPLLIGVWGNPASVRASVGKPLMGRLFPTIAAEERVERFVLRRADIIAVQNEDNRRFVLFQGVNKERTRIFRLGNALSADHFRPIDDRPDGGPDLAELDLGERQVAMVISRLQDLKLVDHVVDAVAYLKGFGTRVDVLFVGDGPFKQQLISHAEALGVADQIHLAGNRPQDWIARVAPCVTMIVSPLTGRALGEAALSAAPVVAYDLDWHAELIEDGVTGLLVPAHDRGALADAMRQIITNPKQARTMGLALRQKALQLLDPAAADAAQGAVYDSMIGRLN